MHLIACLGNPEKIYEKNRHNVGFRVADQLIADFGLQAKGRKHQALLFEGEIEQQKILLIKPQTYMNLSGDAVLACLNFFKIPKENLLVIYDDFDIPFGSIRLKPQGSAGTHNGMKSIVQRVGSQQFPRLRIGIGPLPEKWNVSDFVLSNFTPTEEKHLPQILTTASQTIQTIYKSSLTTAMNSSSQNSKHQLKKESGQSIHTITLD